MTVLVDIDIAWYTAPNRSIQAPKNAGKTFIRAIFWPFVVRVCFFFTPSML